MVGGIIDIRRAMISSQNLGQTNLTWVNLVFFILFSNQSNDEKVHANQMTYFLNVPNKA